MDSKTYGIIGGVVLVIGLLHIFLGSTKSTERNYTQAETLFQHRRYQGAIEKYQKAIKASQKLGARTKHIHKDFPTLAKYKIALCYEKLGTKNNNSRYYSKAISLIDKTLTETVDYKHRENLYYLWAQILYKKKEYVQAELKYSYFINNFPNSALVVEALYYDGKINKDLSRFSDSQSSFQRIIDEFPSSKYRSEAEFYIPELIVAKNNITNSLESQTEDQRTYDTALRALASGDIYESYQLFIGIIDQYPESPLISNVFEKVGDMYYEAGNTVNARQYFENAISTNTDNDRNHLLKNKYNRTLLRPDTAERTDDTKVMNERFTKAIFLRKKEEYLEAAKLFETLSNAEETSNFGLSVHDSIYALYWGGICYFKAAKQNEDKTLFENAEELLKRRIVDYRDTSDLISTYFYLASTYWYWAKIDGNDPEKYKSVIDTVNDAERKTKRTSNTNYDNWYNQLQDLKLNAERKINPYHQPTPRSIRPEEQLVKQGRLHLISGELNKAMKDAMESLKMDPSYNPAKQLLNQIAERYYERGWTFFSESLYDYAIVEFEKCIEIAGRHKKAYCNLGVLNIMNEDYTTAIKVLKKAINIDSNFKEAHYNIGIAYLRQGQFEMAKDAAITALNIDPNYEEAKTLRDVIAD